MSVMFSFLYTQYIFYAIDKFIYSINIIIHGFGFFFDGSDDFLKNVQNTERIGKINY